MIGEITPLVKVAGRRTWSLAVIGHATGATLSASVLGLALGTLGLIVGLDRWSTSVGWFMGTALIVCAVRDAGLVRTALPSLQRQTPRWFRHQFPPGWVGLLWGMDLGQGWTTRILYTSFYALVIWALLAAEPVTAAVVLGAYGLGRALPVLVVGAIWSNKRFEQVIRWPIFSQPVQQQVNAIALAATGVALMGLNSWG